MKELKAIEYKKFENIKHVRDDGSEYWNARELAGALEYTKWENFIKVIKRAMIACENSGHSVSADFPEVRKIVDAGATRKTIRDYELSRYACYLIVQNGDPRKEVIALGQTVAARTVCPRITGNPCPRFAGSCPPAVFAGGLNVTRIHLRGHFSRHGHLLYAYGSGNRI